MNVDGNIESAGNPHDKSQARQFHGYLHNDEARLFGGLLCFLGGDGPSHPF